MVLGGHLLAEALRCGAALLSPSTGTRYTLERILGEGAHGQVWLARSSGGVSYAVKVVISSAQHPQEAERVASEISKAQAASDVVGDLVPRFDEAFYAERPDPRTGEPIGLLVIVMEFVDGLSLDQVVARRPLPEGHAAVVLRSLCLALQRLHARGTIHRDVKSANIMLAATGRVYLCDFGVSKYLERSTAVAKTVAGTPFYMAPEVVRGAKLGKESGYGCSADVWSVGITAIELVEGSPPLARNAMCKANAWQVFDVIAKDPSPRLSRKFSPLMRQFVARCLAKDSSRRATSQELLQDPFGFLQPFPGDGQQMLRELMVHVRTVDGPVAARAQPTFGLVSITVKELQHTSFAGSPGRRTTGSGVASSSRGSTASDVTGTSEDLWIPGEREALPLSESANTSPGRLRAGSGQRPTELTFRAVPAERRAGAEQPPRPHPSSPPPTPHLTLALWESASQSPASNHGDQHLRTASCGSVISV